MCSVDRWLQVEVWYNKLVSICGFPCNHQHEILWIEVELFTSPFLPSPLARPYRKGLGAKLPVGLIYKPPQN